MTVAAGSYRSTRYKRQTAQGVYSAVGGQVLRRSGGAMTLERSTIDNPQIRADKQKAMARQGVGMVTFAHEDVLAPGTLAPFWESVILGTFATAATSGALITVAAAVTTAPAGTFTRSTGSFITDGFTVGKVIRATGWATTGVPNNTHNFVIIALTALIMTLYPIDGVALAAKAAGDSVTITEVGKSVKTPATGHVSHYYTMEDWHPDITQSEQAFDTRVDSIALKFAPNQNITCSVAFKGLNFTQAASVYFSTPTAEASTDLCAMATAKLVVGGVVVATVTAADLNISCGLDMPAVIGSATYPFIADTTVTADGNLTVLWEDQTLMSAYQNETDLTLVIVAANGRGAAADFVGFTLGRCRLFSATKSTDEKSLTKAYKLMGAENTANATGTVASTLSIQDSLAP